MKKSLLFLFVFVMLCLPTDVSAQAEFIDNAFQRAAMPPAAGGWTVTAKVTMNAPGKEYISARGKVTLQSDGSLTGDLPMSLDKKEIAHNTLRFSIRKNNPAIVTITRMIAGKPFLGRSAALVSLPVDPNFNYLSGSIQWGGSREIRVDLETEPAQPIGARYHITGRMEVTNAEDDFLGADNTCEIYGQVNITLVDKDHKDLPPRQLFTLIEQAAMKGFKLNFDKNLYFDRYFDEPNWSFFHIQGWILDEDGGPVDQTDDDVLFGTGKDWTRKGFRFGDQRGKVGDVDHYVIPGDRDSENAEIYFTVTKIADLYKKP